MEPDKQTDISSDSFAAFEFEPDGKEVPEERAKCGRKRRISTVTRRGENGDGAFDDVAEQRGGGESLIASTQNVGCADIARSDRPDIGAAGCAREQEAKRNRAEQIAESEGKSGDHTYS